MKMLRCLALFTLLILPFSALAQVPGPPTPATSTADNADAAPDYSQEGYVLEKVRTVYTFQKDGTGTRELNARIKVQNQAGVTQWGQLIFGYNSANERLDIKYVRVLKADGSVVNAPLDTVQDLSIPLEKEAPMYTDYRQKHLSVPGLRPGEVVEYDIVTVIQTALAPGQFWMEYNFAKTEIVLNEELEVNVPVERAVKLKTRPGKEPKITENAGRRIYSWTSSQLDKDDDDKDKAQKKKKSSPKEPEAPAVQMTTFASWEELGRWYGGLERDRREPAAEILAKAAELTAGKTTDLDKIQALYDYVATNFRYISLSFGVGRFQPHSATDVLHNQYGDCKDKHTLLASLLEASGYHASSVLIHSSRKLDPDVPSPAQFDHVISLVPLPNEEVWMDTTTEVAPFRLLVLPLRKKQALVIPANGVPHLEETPSSPPMKNRQVQDIEGKVNEFGRLNAHVKYVMRGDTEVLMRSLFRRVPNSKWQQFVKEMNTMSGLSGDVSDVKVSPPEDTHEAFQFEYEISSPNFVDTSKKKSDLTLPLSQVMLPEADDDDPKQDTEVIKLGAQGEYTYRIHLEFPAKYTAKVPLPFSMKRDYGQYEAAYKMDGGVFTAERVLNIQDDELPGSRTSDYLAFRRAVTADTGQRLAVDSSAAGSPTATADLKGDDLYDAAKAALDRGNFTMAVTLLQRLVELDPKHKTAWLTLGAAYMRQRQTDKAIDAFKKQVELYPYSEFAYNNLGWGYGVARKYDDAIAAYSKAIEINPLSDYAHGALAQTYSEAHQYEKAAAEFEKAVSLKRDDVFLQIHLGTAYLDLKQDDKALAAFDQAIQLSATPVVWNNIAYDLSLKQVHLDKAEQYSQSAVTATAATLRNVNLDQLTERDLDEVRSLASYWDTLGWVYFAKNEMDKAEKYVESAWMLSESSEEADHLGQIYEKLGRKDDAIRAYALSLNAVRPDPETRTRLAPLVGGEAKVNAVVVRHADDEQHARTIILGKTTRTGSAEFWVMLSPGGAQAKVTGTKFISGDEKMRDMGDTLKRGGFGAVFPDDVPANVVRRGILSCSTLTGNCMFVIMPMDDTLSVN